jgi:hypothetical protein
MNDYIYIDNNASGKEFMYRMLNHGYIVAYEDSEEILIKRVHK